MTTRTDTLGPPWWGDRPLYIVGGGPSLRGYDISKLRRRGRVLGVNRAPELVPCDAFFTQDRRFAHYWRSTICGWVADGIECIVALPENRADCRVPGAVNILRGGEADIPSLGLIDHGKHSGYGALRVALLKGATDITLLGYDLTNDGRDKPTHWHGGYPEYEKGVARLRIYYDRWARAFDRIASELPVGAIVRNANPGSAVRCFPFTTYEEAIG